jgi:hypothetical protein
MDGAGVAQGRDSPTRFIFIGVNGTRPSPHRIAHYGGTPNNAETHIRRDAGRADARSAGRHNPARLLLCPRVRQRGATRAEYLPWLPRHPESHDP